MKQDTWEEFAPRRKKRRVWLIVVSVLLSLVLIAVAAVAGLAKYFLNKIERVKPEESFTLSAEEIAQLSQEDPQLPPGETTPPAMDEEDVVWDGDPREFIGDGKNIINILLIGQDRRPGEGRRRSDAMILCTVNRKTKQLTMTSFLRDLYVQIPDYHDDRLNVAYATGGMARLEEALLQNFGIRVDGSVEVDFTDFQNLIDMMGGVDIYMTEEEAAFLQQTRQWEKTAGMNHLNGQEALVYARIRYLDSDFNRTNRQRKVLRSLFESVRGSNLGQMLDIIDSVLRLVRTNLTDGQIIRYVAAFFPMLEGCEIKTQQIPVADGYVSAYIEGKAVLVPDLEVNRQFLLDTLS